MKELMVEISKMETSGKSPEEIIIEMMKLSAAYDHRARSEAVKRGLARKLRLENKIKSSQQQQMRV